MRDSFGRNIDYMRISITDRCNLCCTYCRPDQARRISHDEVLRYEEFIKICAVAGELGIKTIKVTGGEPLMRKGALDFIGRLKALPGIKAVTLTTNGILLAGKAGELKASRVDAVNVSLDAADPVKFRDITGQDCWKAAHEGILLCERLGIKTKINCVLMKENLDQVLPLSAYARDHHIDVRFIELMPIGAGADGPVLPMKKARDLLLRACPDLHPTSEKRGFGPAVYETGEALKGCIGWIPALSHSFCHRCNRIRITSEGKVKPCLCYGESLDLRAPLRAGASPEDLREILAAAIHGKPGAHCFQEKQSVTEDRAMSSIGG